MASRRFERSDTPKSPPSGTSKNGRRTPNPRYRAHSSSQTNRNNHASDRWWTKQSQIRIFLDGLPAGTEVKHIHDWFSPEGTIVLITVDDGQSRGKIVFAPPPDVPFWQTGTKVIHHFDFMGSHPDGVTIRMSVAPENQQRPSKPEDQVSLYPQFLKLFAKSFDFGAMVSRTGMQSIRHFKSGRFHSRDLRVEFNSNSKRLEIYFSIPGKDQSWEGLREYKVLMDTAQMKDVFFNNLSNGDCALTFSMALPPQYFWKSHDGPEHIPYGAKIWSHLDSWNRATDVVENIQTPLRYPVALSNKVADREFLEIGRLTTFRIVLDRQEDRRGVALFAQLHQALVDSNVVFNSDEIQITSGGENMWSYLDHHYNSSLTGTTTSELLSFPKNHVYLPFEVRYQLEVCVSRGILSEYTINLEFLTQLAGMAPIKARQLLEYIMDHGEPLLDPMSLFENTDADAYYPNLRLPHYCALVRKASITPTTIRFSTPNAETSNRVLRAYNHLQDRFLRVQFIEESEKSRIGMYRPQNDAIYNRIMRALYHGIQIGDRHYEFLAFGNSQLRECGAYFFSPTGHTSCDDIRAWMGQFDHIKIVAKYAARLGQCLSTTREIRGIAAPQITKIPDVEKNGYCFSDGVGKMSPVVASLVIEELALDGFQEPAAFQFRMGGCKGLLTVCPEINGINVHIRESQRKFESRYNKLEIIRSAKPATATLNRQTITILENLGVPKLVFLNLLDRQLARFEAAMVNTNDAISMLRQHVDENQTTLTIADLLEADFKNESTREPFVTTILELWRSWSLKLLKEKARIEVEESAFVLGCMDETGSLRGHDSTTEGSQDKDENKLPQIFLQLSDSVSTRKTKIVEGICIVGRNPSLHPGDIRVVQAVDEPRLHHLKDVVVFPRGGDRPVPNMLSGGDLDGDDFFVIWDENLIPSEWNHPPMNYSGVKAKEVESGVTVDHLRDFFVSYMKSDVLGLAVDFPKTGEPVIWNPRLQPKGWPHFMEKKKGSYQSKKALGVIYDRVSRQSAEFTPNWANNFDERITNKFELSDDILRTVTDVKKDYDISMRRLLTQHNIKTEFELWTGFAMSKPAIGSDYKMQEVLGKEYETLKQRFREICYQKAGGDSTEKRDLFVAAMYKVTEDQVKTALSLPEASEDSSGEEHTQSMPLITFPWIFHRDMIRIAKGDKYGSKDSVLAVSERTKECQKSLGTQTNSGDDTNKASIDEKDQLGNIIAETEVLIPGLGGEDSSSNSGSDSPDDTRHHPYSTTSASSSDNEGVMITEPDGLNAQNSSNVIASFGDSLSISATIVVDGPANFASESGDEAVVQRQPELNHGVLIELDDESDEEAAEDRLIRMCA
uniref:RNA-dependent RNA polymerase n=1 Tax=Bionectria ochroleuca TaxID=29856 RepID=A0A8H7NJT6_BIOOC